MSQARFQKQQREKARRERAAAKSAKRAERREARPPEPSTSPADHAAILEDLAQLHERFDAGLITFEDFEDGKQQLSAQLDIR
jgi:hypothetical protein